MSGAVLLPVAEAQARLLAMARPVASEQVSLAQAAGRWLAQDLVARRDQPSADLSAMDGYAVRFTDLPGPLAVIGESAAGRPFSGAVKPREAVRIFTGAVMPAGADTVIVQEEAATEGAAVRLDGPGPGKQGGNVRARGRDFAHGQRLIARGTRLGPAAIGLAAASGHTALSVARPIRAALIATGDELVPSGAPARPGQLPESNAVMLAAMLGGWPVALDNRGIILDRLDALTTALDPAGADVIVTIGGASVGDHDLVRPAIVAAGGAIDFWRIAMRPGKPLIVGRIGDAILLGLPGNPVSAFVTATLFLKPLVAALSGVADPLPPRGTAALAAPLAANDAREDYLRGTLVGDRVMPAAQQDSAMLATLAASDCLIIRPPHAPPAREGEIVQIISIA